jgi:hypothetical protein
MRPGRAPASLLVAVLLWAVSAAPAAAQSLEPVGMFREPLHVAAAPGDYERLYVVEKGGVVRVRRLDRDETRVFLDLSGRVSTGTERGLLSIAFPTDHQASRLFYVAYTDRGGDVRIEQYRAASADAADPASARPLQVIEHSHAALHNGGGLQFRGGHLFASVGDGKTFPSPAQDAGSQLGKVLEIDPASGTASVFALGLRNPWRFSFDRQTGDLVIGDVGENSREEIDFLPAAGPAGANFGWPCFEGLRAFPRGSCSAPDHRPPVIVHNHSDGFCSIIGGYVVRDAGSPLAGRYVYGDLCSSTLRSAVVTAGGASDARPTGMDVPSLASFGEDNCGRVYAVSLEGPVYRIGSSPCVPTGESQSAVGAPGAGAPRRRSRSARRALRLSFAMAPRRLRALARSRAGVRVACSRGCRVRVALLVDRAAARRLGTGRLIARGGTRIARRGRGVARLLVVRGAARRLRRARSLGAVLRIRATDARGTVRTVRRPVALRR